MNYCTNHKYFWENFAKKSTAQARAGRSVTVSGALWHSSARSAMRASGSW
jgi:hypothetical protein